MKALLVNGSPNRVRGVHATILDSFGEGLREAEVDVTRLDVYKSRILPCQGCFSCWSHTPGECVQDDDMRSILDLVSQSDFLVLATPVYVDGMTGPMKTFLDRFIPLLKGGVELRQGHMRHLTREHARHCKLVLLSASGFTEMDNFDPLVSHVKAACRNLGMEYVGEILVPSGWYLEGDSRDEAMKMVKSAGRDLPETGIIPDGLSTKMRSMVSRDEVIDSMNRYYKRYE